MKVKELILKSHLTNEQKVRIADHSQKMTFTTDDRYCFNLDSNEVERLMKLKVNSFYVSDQYLEIHAE